MLRLNSMIDSNFLISLGVSSCGWKRYCMKGVGSSWLLVTKVWEVHGYHPCGLGSSECSVISSLSIIPSVTRSVEFPLEQGMLLMYVPSRAFQTASCQVTTSCSRPLSHATKDNHYSGCHSVPVLPTLQWGNNLSNS